jgi:hypothetical protein
VPTTRLAAKTSPAPVGSTASTTSPGTAACSPVLASTASAPAAPQVTTASGTRSASRASAARGVPVRVYAIASAAFGVNAWQCASRSSSEPAQRSAGSQPTSAKTSAPAACARRIQPAGSAPMWTIAARPGGSVPIRSSPLTGGGCPCVIRARSPPYASDTVTGVGQPAMRRDRARSTPSTSDNTCQQYAPNASAPNAAASAARRSKRASVTAKLAIPPGVAVNCLVHTSVPGAGGASSPANARSANSSPASRTSMPPCSSVSSFLADMRGILHLHARL